MSRAIGLILVAAVAACSADPPLLRVESAPTPAGYRLTLIAAPGARINARLKPALELRDGRVVRFDSPHLTADSSYFTQAPVAEVIPATAAVHGLLRVSVCPAGEEVCRRVELEL